MAIFRRGRANEAAPGNALGTQTPERGGLTPVANWPDQSLARGVAPAPVPSLFAGVCRYYHDCFAADSRGGVLTNVLDKNQAEYLTFNENIDLILTGQTSQLDMPLATGVTAQNAADVNRRERFLIYGSLFLVGRGRAGGKSRGELYCAPLLYWPAHIEQEGSQAFMSIDLDEQRINFPLLASLIDAE